MDALILLLNQSFPTAFTKAKQSSTEHLVRAYLQIQKLVNFLLCKLNTIHGRTVIHHLAMANSEKVTASFIPYVPPRVKMLSAT